MHKEEERLPIYTGDIRSHVEPILRSKKLQTEISLFYRDLNLSGDETLEWVLDQIYFGHKGLLIDYNGYEIELNRWFVHELFGEEPRRWLNALKKWADRGPLQRLQARCVERFMALYFAMRIYQERLKLSQA